MVIEDRLYTLQNSIALYKSGIIALQVRGDLIHPECETMEEVQLTKRFLRVVNTDEVCARCGKEFHG